MWHEARKQEKKIRSMMVDHQKRADRRRQFYEKIKMDPTQFVRVYGRVAKIHLEPSVALAAEGPQSMVAWAGDRNTMIDRFDVRAHLDYIPEYISSDPVELNSDEEEEELRCNYERYRILVQNECAGVTEEQCLQQLYIDEQFGGIDLKQKEKEKEEEKKKLALAKAAINFSYDDGKKDNGEGKEAFDPDDEKDDGDDADESSDEEVDLDLVFEIDNLNEEQMVLLNKCSVQFGMRGDLYIEHLYKDREEMEMLKQAKQEEDEKAQFSGRKSRRERRAFKEKKLRLKGASPPSYASKSQVKTDILRRGSSSSRSRSKSPVVTQGRTTYITSFGANSDEENAVTIQGPQLPPPDYFQKAKSTKMRDKSRSSKSRSRSRQRSKSRSRSRTNRRYRSSSRNRDRSRRSNSRSKSSRFDRQGRYPPRDYRRRSSDRQRYRRSSSRSRRSRSRSRGRQSRSRSRDRRNRSPRARSPHVSRKVIKSKSRSPLPIRDVSAAPRVPSPPPLKRYRRESMSSSNSNSDDSDAESKSSSTVQKDKRVEPTQPVGNKEGGAAGKGKLSAAEKLKRRLQLQLNKNFKADKKAQKEKVEKMEQERIEREEDIRMMAIEMRRRAREKAAQESDDDYRHSDDVPSRSRRSRSRSSDRSDDQEKQQGEIRPLLSIKLDIKERSDFDCSRKDRDEKRRDIDERKKPKQYDERRRWNDDERELDLRKRSEERSESRRFRDDSGRERDYDKVNRSSDMSRSRNRKHYDSDDESNLSSRPLVDY